MTKNERREEVAVGGWTSSVAMAAIGLFAFLCCIAIIVVFFQKDPKPWDMAQALAETFAAVVVIWAVFYTKDQIDESKRGRYLEIVDRLYSEFTHPEKTADRRFVIVDLPRGADVDVRQVLADMPQAEKTRMKSVLNSLDRAYLLTDGDYIPDALVLPWLSPMVVKAWEALRPYVMFVRETRGEDDYYDGAENLYTRCLEWRAIHIVDEGRRQILDPSAPTI